MHQVGILFIEIFKIRQQRYILMPKTDIFTGTRRWGQGSHIYGEHVVTVPVSESVYKTSGVPRNFVRGRVQQIQLRIEDRENGGLGAVTPSQGFWRQL